MDDNRVYERLGEVSGKLEMIGTAVRDLTIAVKEKDKATDERLTKLETESAETKAKVKTLKFVASTIGAMISAVGAERVVALAGFFH